MLDRPFTLLVFAVAGWIASPSRAAFVAQPDGSLLENFNDGVVDTVTWASNLLGDPISVSENSGELKIVQTLGFNGAYSTRSPLNRSLVEPATAGNENHRVRAIMRRRDPSDDRVSFGLSITDKEFQRTCGDGGNYACMTWQYVGQGVPANTFSPGDLLDLPVYPQRRTSLPYSEFMVQVRHNGGPLITPYQTEVPGHPGKFDFFDTPGHVRQAPLWDYTGQTRYAFEINWKTTTTGDFSITEIRSEDLNNDLIVDILDFGQFAGDFGQAGTTSDFDSSGTVDIADFARLAGEFGQPSTVLSSKSLDWSHSSPNLDPSASLCNTACWPGAIGVQIYAHNVGTVWVDSIHIFGDAGMAAEHNPEPTSAVLLGVAMLALVRRRTG